jgi:hypothetical protein
MLIQAELDRVGKFNMSKFLQENPTAIFRVECADDYYGHNIFIGFEFDLERPELECHNIGGIKFSYESDAEFEVTKSNKFSAKEKEMLKERIRETEKRNNLIAKEYFNKLETERNRVSSLVNSYVEQ